MARRRARSTKARASARPPAPAARGRPRPSVVAGPRRVPSPARLHVMVEAPRSHVVCRVCGRIASVPLDTETQLLLERASRQAPEGWVVEHISFSLAGSCARCREGTAPTA